MNLCRIGHLFDQCGIRGPDSIGCQQLRGNPARSSIAQADQDAPVLEIPQSLNGKIAAREDPNRLMEHAPDGQPFAKLLLPPLLGLLTGKTSLQGADEATLTNPAFTPVLSSTRAWSVAKPSVVSRSSRLTPLASRSAR